MRGCSGRARSRVLVLFIAADRLLNTQITKFTGTKQ